MKSRFGKVGLIMVALVVAIGLMGAAFASWMDSLTISGEVSTGDLDLEVVRYSGTWVWKMPDHGIYEWHGWTDEFPGTPTDAVDLIAYALMRAPGTGEDADVVGETYNIFPFESFMCDVLLHYNGSVPAIVWAEQAYLTGDQALIDIMGWDYSIPAPKAIFDTATVGTYDGTTFTPAAFNEGFGPGRINLYNGWQMHYCDYLLRQVIMDLPQDNTLQGLSAQWGVDINAIQWNEWPVS
jgi:hypothetical protein